ncbi:MULTISPECIES: KpsF/GutQ family sugar-phosphate isomerase [unclassified Caballeronia]|uniref:KpsF/GutQ family sugar-phosphate isomerase n=1 Tax=unclassified Caballeronia TaxID=2646786 RepID=UPI0028590D54|nr:MULTISPECIES: KpsF/GutQ family sugar-phosphate isomerase [unclassified Caballeronia]MDR5741110.1 KpsF/GutQ family sugar-phosphate isomerase [Caballeronia sp. LZ016]MDR5807010.1 KpsF/GutQ family sugar-phosphate isomerase [Caballeronia sp. LZ019]
MNTPSHISIARQVFDIEMNGLRAVRSLIDDSFASAVECMLASRGRVVLCGIGKSGYVARKTFATLVSTGTPSLFMHPGEAFHGDLGMVLPEDVFLMMSNSGETEEILRLVPFIQDNGNKMIALTGNAESSLARVADHHLNIRIEEEACPLQLAPTASTTAALVMGDALAIALMKARNFDAENFARFHPGGSLGRKLLQRVRDALHPATFVPANAPATAVIAKLAQSRTGLICVGTETALEGIVTDGDLRRALNRQADSGFFDLKAANLMTGKPKTINSAARCAEADALMETTGVNSLVVMSEGSVTGIYQLLNKIH